MTKHPNRWLCLVAFTALAAGCAGVQKEAFIREQAGEYVYELPADKLWPQVVSLMKEQGFNFRQDPTRFVLTTDWKEAMGSSEMAASATRYHVEAVRIDPTHTRVTFFKNTMSRGGGGSDVGMTSQERHAATNAAQNTNTGGRVMGNAQGVRDLEMEWLLLQRVNPEDAKELQEEADAKFK